MSSGMDNSCPKCKSQQTHMMLYLSTVQSERMPTGQWVCEVCHNKWTPRDVETMTVDLAERIQVLHAMLAQVESRLLAISIPDAMLAQAESLERQAELMFDRAQRIRASLAADTLNKSLLTHEGEQIEIEIAACVYCRRAGMKVTKRQIREVVDMFTHTKGE